MDYKVEVLKRVPGARAYESRFNISVTKYRIENGRKPLSAWKSNEVDAWKSAFFKLVEGAIK